LAGFHVIMYGRFWVFTEVDIELGLKERGMGALHQHRKEHGC
jgi:hypothetical protein